MFVRMTCGFAGLNWRVSLIAPRRGDIPAMPQGAEYFPLEYERGYLKRLRRASRVMPLLRQLEPDVVLFPDPDLMGALVRYRRQSGALVVFDRHENFEQHWKLHKASNPADALLSRLYPAYERYAVRRLDGVVVVFEEMRKAIPQGVPTLVAHNYPTRNVVEALAVPPPPGTPQYTTVFIGSFRKAYGHMHLLELAHELVLKRGRSDFTLFIAGQFDPGLDTEVAKYIADHGLQTNITLKPHTILHHEVVSLVAASRIGMCPLSQQIALPNNLHNKMLEFMAAGLPVIASDIRPGGRIIADSGCGKLLWAEQLPQIADTVEHWLDHPGEAQALGKRGQQYAFEKLVWESDLTQLAAWLERLRNQRTAR